MRERATGGKYLAKSELGRLYKDHWTCTFSASPWLILLKNLTCELGMRHYKTSVACTTGTLNKFNRIMYVAVGSYDVSLSLLIG